MIRLGHVIGAAIGSIGGGLYFGSPPSIMFMSFALAIATVVLLELFVGAVVARMSK